MKKLFLFIFTLFVIMPVFAQAETEPVDVNFVSVLKNIFLPAIIAQFTVLFADAWKWFNTPEWSWSTLFSTKLKPFLLTTIGGIVLYFILGFIPAVQPFIEILVGSPIGSLTAATLFGAAAAIIDGLTKKVKI